MKIIIETSFSSGWWEGGHLLPHWRTFLSIKARGLIFCLTHREQWLWHFQANWGWRVIAAEGQKEWWFQIFWVPCWWKGNRRGVGRRKWVLVPLLMNIILMERKRSKIKMKFIFINGLFDEMVNGKACCNRFSINKWREIKRVIEIAWSTQSKRKPIHTTKWKGKSKFIPTFLFASTMSLSPSSFLSKPNPKSAW